MESIYATSQRDGVDFNLAFIGSDFTVEHKEPFDRAYMRALFDYGYQRARAGYPWSKAPPILQTPGKLQSMATSGKERDAIGSPN